jgi:hypothetical protein
MRALLVLLSLVVCTGAAEAECVDVKYYTAQCLDLALLDCTETKSSFVHQVCYDAQKRFMVILLRIIRYPFLRGCGARAFGPRPARLSRHFAHWGSWG